MGGQRDDPGEFTLTAMQSATTFASAHRFVLGGNIEVEENIFASSVQESCIRDKSVDSISRRFHIFFGQAKLPR